MKDMQGAGYTPEKLVDTIPLLGVEVEKIDETEITINVSPNRPDLLDYVGFVRALDNFTGKKVPAEGHYKLGENPVLTITVEKPVTKVRPFVAGMVVRNLRLKGNMLKYYINFTDKFADTYGRKRKKLAIGLHDLSKIKGNLVYTAARTDSFVPLNSSKKMGFDQIMEAHARGQEYRDAVPNYGTEKVMYPFLRDDGNIIALIPITNAEATRVTEDTTEIFVDITGTSINTVNGAANLLACSFIDAGADVYPVTVAYEKGSEVCPALEYDTRKLPLRKAELALGVMLGRHNVVAFANKMGHVAAKYGNSIVFYVPPYRVDVISERDLIEDIAIAFGYGNIAPLPIASVGAGLANDLIDYQNKLAVTMIGLGYTEAVNMMLTNERMNFENMRCDYKSKRYVSIADAKSVNVSMLRTDILPGLLQNLADSLSEPMPQRLFEVGSVFNLVNDKLTESVRMAFACEHAKANFAEAKSVMESVLKYRDVTEYSIEAHSNPSYIEGRCATVRVNGSIVGVFGELHPATLTAFGIEEPVVAGELTIVKEISYSQGGKNA